MKGILVQMDIQGVIKSLVVSIVDLFRPRMLFMILAIPVFVFVVWAFLAWFSWGFLLGWTEGWVNSTSWVLNFTNWLSQEWGFDVTTLTFFMTLFWVVLVLFPLIFISIIVLTSVLTMPIIVQYREREFPTLEKKRGFGTLNQLWQTLTSGVVFAILWSFIVPLWLIPPLGPTLSFILTSWFQKKVLAVECLAEHASKEEFKILMKQNRSEIWLLSFVMTMMLTIPIFNFIVPIYAGLVFSHFLFQKLNRWRTQ